MAPGGRWDRPHHPQARLHVRRLDTRGPAPVRHGGKGAVLWDGMVPAAVWGTPCHPEALLHGEADLHGLLARHVASHAWSFIAASAREAPSAELDAPTQLLANHHAIGNGVLRFVPPGKLHPREASLPGAGGLPGPRKSRGRTSQGPPGDYLTPPGRPGRGPRFPGPRDPESRGSDTSDIRVAPGRTLAWTERPYSE